MGPVPPKKHDKDQDRPVKPAIHGKALLLESSVKRGRVFQRLATEGGMRCAGDGAAVDRGMDEKCHCYGSAQRHAGADPALYWFTEGWRLLDEIYFRRARSIE